MIITPLSETDSFNTTMNKDSFNGCWNLLTSGQSARGLLSGSASSDGTVTARTLSDDHTDGRLLTGSLIESHLNQSSIQNKKFIRGQVAVTTFDGKNVTPESKKCPQQYTTHD
jgi:hypothetical protein